MYNLAILPYYQLVFQFWCTKEEIEFWLREYRASNVLGIEPDRIVWVKAGGT